MGQESAKRFIICLSTLGLAALMLIARLRDSRPELHVGKHCVAFDTSDIHAWPSIVYFIEVRHRQRFVPEDQPRLLRKCRLQVLMFLIILA